MKHVTVAVDSVEPTDNGLWLVLAYPHRDVWVLGERVVKVEEES